MILHIMSGDVAMFLYLSFPVVGQHLLYNFAKYVDVSASVLCHSFCQVWVVLLYIIHVYPQPNLLSVGNCNLDEKIPVS